MEKWRTLLRSGLECLDSLDDIGVDRTWWALGGGASLILRYEHRGTNDADFFLRNAQVIPALSPRLNDKVAHITEDYEECSSSLKLTLPAGDIDFVVAAQLTRPATEWRVVEGREIQVETALEVVAKKVFYRGVDFKARDLVDLAFLLEHEPDFGDLLAPTVESRLDGLGRRLRVLEADWPKMAGPVPLLPPTEAILDRAPAIVRAWIERHTPR